MFCVGVFVKILCAQKINSAFKPNENKIIPIQIEPDRLCLASPTMSTSSSSKKTAILQEDVVIFTAVRSAITKVCQFRMLLIPSNNLLTLLKSSC